LDAGPVQISTSSEILLRNSHQNSQSGAKKITAFDGCLQITYFIGVMVDAVGIEPATCRLRATEFASPPAANVFYKPLYKRRLRAAKKFLIAINIA
jgi:hypothetical protein